jgi:hypothetical protein
MSTVHTAATPAERHFASSTSCATAGRREGMLRRRPKGPEE